MPPKQKPHRSLQEVETPPDLVAAIETRFGKIDFDLAASPGNAKAPRYFTKADDSLKQDWVRLPGKPRVAYLNPEFGTIKPWAEKCALVRHQARLTLMLVPLGTQGWSALNMWGKAYVLKLRGRVTFVGHKTPFPKDLALAVYGYGLVGEEVWDWNQECPF